MSKLQMSQYDLDLPNVSKWCSDRGKRLYVFDLEATQKSPHFHRCGIIEIAVICVEPSGQILSCSQLIDPELSIPKRVTELTGLADSDVQGMPTWAAWAEPSVWMASQVTCGFNSRTYDCPMIAKQNERYGLTGTKFEQHIDVMRIEGVGPGTLAESAEAAGIRVSETLHRALIDAHVTAQLLDTLIADKTDNELFIQPTDERKPLREKREQVLFALEGGHPDLVQIANRLDLSEIAVSREIYALISGRKIQLESVAEANILGEIQKPVIEFAAAFRLGAVGPSEFIELKERLCKQLDRSVPHFLFRLAWPTGAGSRQDAIVEHLCLDGEIDSDFLADQFNVARSTIEGDIDRLIEDGRIDYHSITNTTLISELRGAVRAATDHVWDEKKRLKPLKEYLEEELGCTVPYRELRVSLRLEGLK